MVKLTTEQFITKAIEVHGNKYDYSKVVYVNKSTKVTIICKKHGAFLQSPHHHTTNRNGCPQCYMYLRSHKQYSTTELFIIKANQKHKDKYTYINTVYKNSRTKVTIICKHHGNFEQTPNNHLRGKGCFICAKECFTHPKTSTTENFIKKSQNIHNNIFSYAETHYTNAHTKVIITCKAHGNFSQTPNMHLKGRGCPKCKSSKGEKTIREFLNNNNYVFAEQYTFPTCKYKKLLRFDFFIPSKNVAIEYDGEYHFLPIHGNDSLTKTQKRDSIKDIFCKNHNIKLIRISYKNSSSINNILIDELFSS